MASERTLKAVSQLFTVNGTVDGVVKVASVRYFKVKARVLLKSSTQPTIALEVKSVPDATTIAVGPIGADILARTDVSAYLVADGATIQQDAQKRMAIAPADIDRATYEEEPVVARRVVQVDENGDMLSSSNPLPIIITNPELATIAADVALIKADVDAIAGDVASMQTDVSAIAGDISTIDTNIALIKSDVSAIASDVSTIDANVALIKSDVSAIDGNIATIQSDVAAIKGDVTSIAGDTSILVSSVANIESDIATIAMTATIVDPYKAWNAALIADGLVTVALDIKRLRGASCVISWAGLTVGEGRVYVEGTVWDGIGSPLWTPLDMDSIVVVGATDHALASLAALEFSHLRLRYEQVVAATLGATITAVMMAK